MRTLLREVLIVIAVAIAVFIVSRTAVQSFIVVGISMEPSFEEGQRLLINRAVYHFREPARGDVIVFQPPGNQPDYIKRIIALPGDTVEIKEEAVYVNGSQLYEPYIKDPPSYTLPPTKIPDNNYFVLGDNRNHSNDSHNDWTVERTAIIGKAWLSIWPPGEWGLAPNYPLQEQLASAELLP
jgi:signal peptidase I